MSIVTHTFVETNGVRLHVAQAGPVTGPLIILLHGFPEFWYGWHHQINTLAGAGYWVWAPDQRGYNLSDKPRNVADYALDTLVSDVIGLINAAGRQKAVVVGHDWGAAVAWWTAVSHPNRVERLVALNVPHPVVMQRFARRDLGQLRRSWYIGFFQVPQLPEKLLSWQRARLLARVLRSSSEPGTFSDTDLVAYRAAWNQPNAVRSMVNWYRAALRVPAGRRPSIRVTVPTLLIWGVYDQFLKREMAQASIDLCDNGRVVFLPTTHWVQHEQPERVGELIMEGGKT
jgi:pimeloyl-ACP methyl ester carboxylesterase